MAGEGPLQGQILWLYPLTPEGAGELSGASFEGAGELSGASFEGAGELSGASFEGAGELSGASFSCPFAQLHPTLFDPMDCSTPGFPVLHLLPEFAQTHVH